MTQTILALALVLGLQAPQCGDSTWKTYASSPGFSVLAITRNGDTAYIDLQGVVVNETGKAGRLIAQKVVAVAGHPGREFVGDRC